MRLSPPGKIPSHHRSEGTSLFGDKVLGRRGDILCGTLSRIGESTRPDGTRLGRGWGETSLITAPSQRLLSLS